MSADLSRERFDPHRDFAGVILQQGRLLLDADFNELVRILDRRLRAETVDLTTFAELAGAPVAGSAWVPRATPNAMKVSVVGGELMIGRGRMYVDGLLVENHGGEPWALDEVLAEEAGTTDVAHGSQPHWPTPDALPTSGAHLAYLDVWQREVTHIEDPGLVEVAVGVDTTARTQTVWQVRLHDLSDTPGATCSTPDEDIEGWPEVIAPSGGRATITAVEVDEEDDPCELPPTGGFRGLEHQTYRVEVHDGGAPGTATFKWSRENASVVLAVTDMPSPTTLRVASVGRDEVLRVATGDWVEVTDDRRELDQRPGVMRQATVDDAARTITFSPALPADLQPSGPAEAAARHLRVKRWDQSGTIRTAAGATLPDLGSTGGVIGVPSGAATQVLLEHGLAASFDTDGLGELHSGDHWIVHARSGEAFEGIEDAPPLGIHHHYARLGIVTFGGSSTVEDCRRLWPPVATGGGESCDCTVCVDPALHASGELTIQAAIDGVRPSGGTVCLHAGLYDVGEGLDISGATSLRLHGQGLSTILFSRGDGIRITGSGAVEVDNLAVVCGAAATGAVVVRNAVVCDLHDLALVALGEGAKRGSALHLEGVQLDLRVRDNILVGRWGIGCGSPLTDTIDLGIYGAVLRITDNLAVGDGGISLGAMSAYLASVEVRGNDVLAGDLQGVLAAGAVAAGGSLRVADNVVWARGDGITVGADAVVDGNTVTTGAAELEGVGAGIVSGIGFPSPAGHVRVTGNRVSRRGGDGIALQRPVSTWTVKHNVVEEAANGIVVDGKGAAEAMSVDNNQVLDVAPGRGGISAAGIALARARSATVSGNTIRRVAVEAVEGRVRAGILAVGVDHLVVAGNVVDVVGPPNFVGVCAGILLSAPFEHATLEANEVRDGSPEPVEGAWFAVLVQRVLGESPDLGGTRAVVPDGESLVLVTGRYAAAVAERGQHVTLSSNAVGGGGFREAVLVRVGGDVVASANQVDHRITPSHADRGEVIGMRLGGETIAAATNRVRGPRSTLVLEPAGEVSFTAVGNIAAGGTHLFGPGSGLPGPWDSLNVSAP